MQHGMNSKIQNKQNELFFLVELLNVTHAGHQHRPTKYVKNTESVGSISHA